MGVACLAAAELTRHAADASHSTATLSETFGQSVGDAKKAIFRKDVTQVRPSQNALCNGV